MAATSPDRLGNLLAALALALTDGATSAAERATGMPGSGTPALLALSQFLDGANVSRLADVLGLTHSGAVRLVAQLEDAGYVRRANLVDRRQVNVLLTATGRRAARRAAAARMEVALAAVHGLTVAQRRQFDPLVSRMVDQLVAARASERLEHGDGGRAWWCRTCNFAACGRAEGRCPAERAAARVRATGSPD